MQAFATFAKVFLSVIVGFGLQQLRSEDALLPHEDAEKGKSSVRIYHKGPFSEKGLVIHLPKIISASAKGSTLNFKYSIWNALGEVVFLDASPDQLFAWSFDYHVGDESICVGGGIGGTTGGHGRLFARLASGKFTEKGMQGSCCSILEKSAQIELPKELKAGGKFTVNFWVSGYLSKSGDAFHESVEIPIEVVD